MRTGLLVAASLAAVALVAHQGTAQAKRGGKTQRARSVLTRLTDADGKAKGRIDLSQRGDNGELTILGQRLTGVTSVDFVAHDGESAEDVIEAGVAVSARGVARLRLRTANDDSLPYDAETVADLEGFTLYVREASTPNTLLQGTIPSLDRGSPRTIRKKDKLTNEDTDANPRGRAVLTARFKGRDGASELQIFVQRLTDGGDLTFWVEDDEQTLWQVGEATASRRGAARYRVRTNQGDPLPFEVQDVRDLAGRGVEIRSGETVLFSGEVPNL